MLKLSEGRFRNGIFDVKYLLKFVVVLRDDDRGFRFFTISKGKKKGGRKNYGKRKGGGRKCY